MEIEKSSVARTERELGTQALPVLQMEYLRSCGEVERLLGQNDKAVQYAMAIISGFVYLSLKDNVPILIALVPVLCAGVFLYVVNIHEFAMIARGYLAFLERRINTLLGLEALSWETRYAKDTNHYLASTIVLATIGAIFGSLASIYSLFNFYHRFDRSALGDAGSEAAFWTYAIWCFGLFAFGSYRISKLGRVRDHVLEKCLRTNVSS